MILDTTTIATAINTNTKAITVAPCAALIINLYIEIY